MDGKSIVNATMTQELTSMIRQYSYIGKSSYSGDSYFDGNISDFRIYSTALTDEDIKQLYESRIKIDKNNSIHCIQFIEDIKPTVVNKKGQVISNELTELRLPPDYQEVEYLESSGTQYINTGIKSSENISFEVAWKDNETISSDRFLFGASDDGNSRLYIGYGWNNSNTGFAIGDSINKLTKVGSFKRAVARYTVGDGLYIDEKKQDISISAFGGKNLDLYLFARNINNAARNFISAKIFYLEIWDSGIPVRDFIPCYNKSNNEPGLYDRIENKFYINNGTGSFTIGPELAGARFYKTQIKANEIIEI